jgi:hypothetical protein
MAFQPHEKSGSVGIKKLSQKQVAAQLIVKRTDSRSQQKNQKQNKPKELKTQKRTIRYGGRRRFQGGGDCASVHRNGG